MKSLTTLTLALGLFALTLPSPSVAQAPALAIDRVHSRIGFTASTLLFDVDGQFHDFQVDVQGDPADPAHAKVTVAVNVASIDTDNAKRDQHLKNQDFLDAPRFPKILFESEQVRVSPKGLELRGTLTMHGHKNKVVIPFKRATGTNGGGRQAISYKGKLTIDRKDWGIGVGSIAAKLSLEDEVELDLLLVTFP